MMQLTDGKESKNQLISFKNGPHTEKDKTNTVSYKLETSAREVKRPRGLLAVTFGSYKEKSPLPKPVRFKERCR